MRLRQSQRFDRIRRTARMGEGDGHSAVGQVPGTDLLQVSVGIETACQSQVAELGEQIHRRCQRILHAENVDELRFGE